MRRPFLAGNWKMNLDRRASLDLARSLADSLPEGRDVAVFPPFVYLDEVARALAGSAIRVGAQNVCDEEAGAFTGEVSAAMLRDVGAELTLVGHSERRHVFGEADELVSRKLQRGLAEGLEVVLCVGETIEERQAGRTEEVVLRQLQAGLEGVGADAVRSVTIAYEPVWAIGTGHVATPEQAGAVHDYLRGVLSGMYDEALGEELRILYGGSVGPKNVSELMAVPSVDGALVGGASLKADSFRAIIQHR